MPLQTQKTEEFFLKIFKTAILVFMALALLAVLGYTPGMAATSHGGWALALLYAGLPCVFKLAALVALSRGVITAPEENP